MEIKDKHQVVYGVFRQNTKDLCGSGELVDTLIFLDFDKACEKAEYFNCINTYDNIHYYVLEITVKQ